jgi:hypothetical protein
MVEEEEEEETIKEKSIVSYTVPYEKRSGEWVSGTKWMVQSRGVQTKAFTARFCYVACSHICTFCIL